MSELIYNGLDFSTLFVYGDPEISILNAQPDLREVSSRNGAAFVGMTYGTSTVSVKLAALGDAETRRMKFSTLGKYLMVDEPKPLYLPDTPNWYYLAVPDGQLDLTRAIQGEITTLTFVLTDPIAYGETKSATMASTSTGYATIGGTAPTYVDITCSEAVPTSYGSGYAWRISVNNLTLGLNFDTNDTVSIQLLSSQRICKVNGSVVIPEIDYDWLLLNPSSSRYTFSRVRGSGEATITWTERWY